MHPPCQQFPGMKWKVCRGHGQGGGGLIDTATVSEIDINTHGFSCILDEFGFKMDGWTRIRVSVLKEETKRPLFSAQCLFFLAESVPLFLEITSQSDSYVVSLVSWFLW